jgi:hypothetical protein
MVIEEKGQSPTGRSEACANFAIGSEATNEQDSVPASSLVSLVSRESRSESSVRASVNRFLVSKCGGSQRSKGIFGVLGVYEGIVNALMRPTAASASAQSVFHRRLDRSEKRYVVERFGEKSRCALSEGPRAHLIIRLGGHEDYGNPTIYFAQLGLKFETT